MFERRAKTIWFWLNMKINVNNNEDALQFWIISYIYDDPNCGNDVVQGVPIYELLKRTLKTMKDRGFKLPILFVELKMFSTKFI